MNVMLRKLFLLFAGLVLGGQAVAACAPAQILRDDVLVVVNDNSISSPQVGDYYCEQRGIDPANVAHVRVPATNDVKLDQFIALRDQLIKHMQENTLPAGVVPVSCDTTQGYTHYYCPATVDQLRQLSRIRYVVMTKGLPIRFQFTGSTLPYNGHASVDNYLRFWLVNFFSQDVFFNITNRAIDFGDGRGMRTVDPVVDFELIVGRIDGVDVQSAMRLVDRAINAEKNGIYGKLYGNKFGGRMFNSGPEGAYWKSWLSNGSKETVYPSWRYLHGLFGELHGLASPAIRHVTEPDCLTYRQSGTVPGECVTAVNRGSIADSTFTSGDHPPGTPTSVIPEPDHALVYQGLTDGLSSLHEFNHLLNWRDSTTCNTLCTPNDTVCQALSTDVYKEIDTRCVRVAEGFMGYNFGSFPVGMMASWPTGWFQSVNSRFDQFDRTGSHTHNFWQPEVRVDEGFDDNFSLWYRNTDDAPSAACYTGVEDYQALPVASCKNDKKININQAVDIQERAINLANPQTITVRFKYRAIGLSRDVQLKAKLLIRQSEYDDGIIIIGPNNQVEYDPINVKTLSAPDDPVDGVSWGDAIVSFTLDPASHQHPQYLYNGIKIRIETSVTFDGQFAIDDVSVEENSLPIPLVNPSFDDGHRQLSGGDSAATFLSRLNGAAFWGNVSHHEMNGHSFDSHPYETLIYFLRGLPLGDAVWFAETHNSGMFYGDPIYSPIAVHLHYLSGSDNRAPKDYFDISVDSPLALTGDALNGTGPNVTTTYSVDYCSGNDFLPCDQNTSWLPVAGLQNRPGGQRNMRLGDWVISNLADGDYVLRLAVTSSNSSSGLSQTFYDYYPVTLYSPSLDNDADGLSNQDEAINGTDPWDSDSDNDFLPDGWEVQFALNPLVGNTNADSDGDGFTDYIEFARVSDPSDNQSLSSVSVLEVDPVNGTDDGQSPFQTVAAAIAAALAGDTISLLPGNHIDSVIYLTIPVNIQGQPDQSAILYPVFMGSGTPGTIVVSDLSISSPGLAIVDGQWLFERNDFSTNTTVHTGTSVEFANNIFANASGNAVNALTGAGVVLENSTFTANNVAVSAGSASSVQVINSIISGNTTADFLGVPMASVSYSLIADESFAGTNGNVSGDPLFVDPLNGDYHLQAGSPAVDAGDPQSAFSLEPASFFDRVNMGRYGNTVEATANLRAPTSPVNINGAVKDQNGADLCAMALASGKYMFTCNPIGDYAFSNLPRRKKDGVVKLQVFADGYFPWTKLLTGSELEPVTMPPVGSCPNYNPPSNPGTYPGSAGKRIDISGTITVGGSGAPVCAMVLASGKYTFTCNATGRYNMNVPLNANGQVKIQVFADGFAPYVFKTDEFQPVNHTLLAKSSECS